MIPEEVTQGLFRKKPVVITAWRTDTPLEIETLEGAMKADAGDWIITGVKGETYPCKPDIFDATYDYVGDDPEALSGAESK